MNKWRAIGKSVAQTALSIDLRSWLDKVDNGVYVFHEGATISRFDWGNAQWLSETKLDRLWLIRLFCREFELFARRLGYEGEAVWQVRIAAEEHHLPAGEALDHIGSEHVLLLGQATGEGQQFVLKPNRYQRARLSYPGEWSEGQTCRLATERFQPTGAAITCWTALSVGPVQESA